MLVFAALLAAEPLLHNHPLGQIQDGSSSAATCAICATGVGRLPIIASAVTVPRLVVSSVSVAPVSVIAVAFALPLASRAPPVY